MAKPLRALRCNEKCFPVCAVQTKRFAGGLTAVKKEAIIKILGFWR